MQHKTGSDSELYEVPDLTREPDDCPEQREFERLEWVRHLRRLESSPHHAHLIPRHGRVRRRTK
jgi:hypothetical protein